MTIQNVSPNTDVARQVSSDTANLQQSRQRTDAERVASEHEGKNKDTVSISPAAHEEQRAEKKNIEPRRLEESRNKMQRPRQPVAKNEPLQAEANVPKRNNEKVEKESAPVARPVEKETPPKARQKAEEIKKTDEPASQKRVTERTQQGLRQRETQQTATAVAQKYANATIRPQNRNILDETI